MSKVKKAFFCQNCGYESVKWLGQCPSCNQWNTFVEEIIQKETLKTNGWQQYHETAERSNKTIRLDEIQTSEEKRLISADEELDRVLGGGIVPGSIILVAGEPGIGKSTLFLQNGLRLTNRIVLYISGEESEQQIKMRAERLCKDPSPRYGENFYLLTETSTQIIFQEIKKTQAGSCHYRFYSNVTNTLYRFFAGKHITDP